MDQWALTFDFGVIGTGLIFIGALSIGKIILSLPFGIYSTFVIEERFRFNKTTAKTYITDMLKGLLLSVIIGAPLLAGIRSEERRVGKDARYRWLRYRYREN